MKKKHDLTACLPFPDPKPARAVPSQVHHPRRGDRLPLELAQLELADLRIHGSPLWDSPSWRGPVHDGAAAGARAGRQSARSGTGIAVRALAARFTPDRSCARAVRQSDQYAFYLDLVGAVLIMALVVLAAILV